MKGYSPLFDDGTVSTDYATKRLHRNDLTIVISSIGIYADTVSITSVYFAYS